MRKFSKDSLIKIISFFRAAAGLQIPVYAAHAAFFILLALHPFLVLLACLLSFASLDAALVGSLLTGILPEVFAEGTGALIRSASLPPRPALLGVSALTLLWAAGRGIHAVRTGLNAVCGVPRKKGYLRTRLISSLYTLCFLALLPVSFLLQIFASRLLLFAGDSVPETLRKLVDLRFFLLLFLQTGLFALMFTVLPDRPCRFRDSLPGALLASCGWLVFTDIFSLYLRCSTPSLPVPGMLWLYGCISIVFYGGALNVRLKKWK